MKLLATNKRILTMLGACPMKESASRGKKVICSVSALTTFIYQACSAISSAIFIVENVSVSVEDTLYALLQIAGLTYLLYALTVAFIWRQRIKHIFVKLSEIYGEYENEDTFHYLTEANDQSEWIWRGYLKYGIGGFLLLSVLMVIASLQYSLNVYGHFRVDKVYHVYKLSLPWDQTTFIGYLGEMLYSFIAGVFYMLVNGAFLFLFVSMCSHHQAFYKICQHSLCRFNDEKQSNGKLFLSTFVRRHIMVRAWFLETAETYSLLILVRLFCSMLLLACSVFQVDLEMKHLSFNIVLVLMAVMISITDLLLYCFFGKAATESHQEIADCLFESNWLDMPIELQKYFILMIANIQKPLYYHGFGVANLDLETFKRYLRTVYTFYMMFKTITSN